jgi:hypothetical protein
VSARRTVISILDVLAVAPGHLEDVRRRIRHELVPLMAELDMRLLRTWMAPAVELIDRPTELLYLWEVDDVAAFWHMRTVAAADPRVLACWDAIDPMLTARERRLMCDPDDETVLR